MMMVVRQSQAAVEETQTAHIRYTFLTLEVMYSESGLLVWVKGESVCL